MAALALGEYKTKSPPEICGAGHVVRTLEAVLWAFHSTQDFASGALKVVNLGEDADTTGAVYGQLAGCYYGEQGIPEAWRKALAMGRFISLMGDEIYALSQQTANVREPSIPAAAPTTAPSAAFAAAHGVLLIAEAEYAPIHRRLEPGPRMFRTEEDFATDVAKFKATLTERCTSISADWSSYVRHQVFLLRRKLTVPLAVSVRIYTASRSSPVANSPALHEGAATHPSNYSYRCSLMYKIHTT